MRTTQSPEECVDAMVMLIAAVGQKPKRVVPDLKAQIGNPYRFRLWGIFTMDAMRPMIATLTSDDDVIAIRFLRGLEIDFSNQNAVTTIGSYEKISSDGVDC